MVKNRKIFLAVVCLMVPLFLISMAPQEAKVNRRKIESEHRQKEKKSAKQYEQAKRDHVRRQSKETQAMMKKSKKDSKKNTPMKPPGGKKCK